MRLFVTKSGQIIYPKPGCLEAFEKIKNGDCEIEITRPRNVKFHRKYMALLNFVFEHWQVEDEQYKNFDVFRKNMAILAGFYEQAYNFKGEIELAAKSIKFSAMDEVEFEDLYNKTINVALKHILKNYKYEELDSVIQELLNFD